MHTYMYSYAYKVWYISIQTAERIRPLILLILCYRSKILNDYAIRRLIIHYIHYRNNSIKIEKLYNSIAIIV